MRASRSAGASPGCSSIGARYSSPPHQRAPVGCGNRCSSDRIERAEPARDRRGHRPDSTEKNCLHSVMSFRRDRFPIL
jgi:hypothetical protein